MTPDDFKAQCQVRYNPASETDAWFHPKFPDVPLSHQDIVNLIEDAKDRYLNKNFKDGDSVQLQRICSAITDILPDGMGFMVFTFPLGSDQGVLRYAANADRKDCINALKEWMIKAGAQEDWMKHL